MTSSSEFKQHQQDETCWQPFCQRLPVSLSLRTPSSVGVGQHCGRQFRSSQYDKAERSPREETRGSTLQPLPRRTNILHRCGVYDDGKPAIKWYDATTHKSKARSPTDKHERNYKLTTTSMTLQTFLGDANSDMSGPRIIYTDSTDSITDLSEVYLHKQSLTTRSIIIIHGFQEDTQAKP